MDVGRVPGVIGETGAGRSTLMHLLERFQLEEIPRPWVGLAFGPGLAGELILIR